VKKQNDDNTTLIRKSTIIHRDTTPNNFLLQEDIFESSGSASENFENSRKQQKSTQEVDDVNSVSNLNHLDRMNITDRIFTLIALYIETETRNTILSRRSIKEKLLIERVFNLKSLYIKKLDEAKLKISILALNFGKYIKLHQDCALTKLVQRLKNAKNNATINKAATNDPEIQIKLKIAKSIKERCLTVYELNPNTMTQPIDDYKIHKQMFDILDYRLSLEDGGDEGKQHYLKLEFDSFIYLYFLDRSQIHSQAEDSLRDFYFGILLSKHKTPKMEIFLSMLKLVKINLYSSQETQFYLKCYSRAKASKMGEYSFQYRKEESE